MEEREDRDIGMRKEVEIFRPGMSSGVRKKPIRKNMKAIIRESKKAFKRELKSGGGIISMADD